MSRKHITTFLFLTILAYTILSSVGLGNEKLAAYSLYFYVFFSVAIAAVSTYVFRNVIENKSK
ncbi:hypothetical protein IX92_24945 (plasmid) [Vibrio coralliilyticus]|uniref:Uncharacterized protein n=1 Tax=Vibrio coralliilyticus TaxID=190893 RepID=A0AAN0SJJ9_9VIBR|nr:hypothetical protein IX92_24945 [Vibrio coralliilyticus]